MHTFMSQCSFFLPLLLDGLICILYCSLSIINRDNNCSTLWIVHYCTLLYDFHFFLQTPCTFICSYLLPTAIEETTPSKKTMNQTQIASLGAMTTSVTSIRGLMALFEACSGLLQQFISVQLSEDNCAPTQTIQHPHAIYFQLL